VRFNLLGAASLGSHFGASAFAQASSPAVDPAAGWLSVIIQSGSFGLIAYLIVVGWPKFQKTVREERAEDRKEFGELLAKANADRQTDRTEFTAALRLVTDFATGQISSVRDATRQEVTTIRAAAKDEIETMRQEQVEMRRMLLEAMTSMRSAVHDVRDVASTTVNKANVALEVARQQGQS
jgi:hypothetical protein